MHSTTQAKYWNNPTGWQDVVDYIKKHKDHVGCNFGMKTFNKIKRTKEYMESGGLVQILMAVIIFRMMQKY